MKIDCHHCLGTGKIEIDGSIGQKIFSLRESRGLSLRQLEEKLDLSNSYISQLETGKIKSPSFDVISILAKFFKVPMEVFRDEEVVINPATRDSFRSKSEQETY